ncbi:hypothetical protein ACP70R_018852 [Stipagrostis hirtigluma subsp. patula]
MVPNEQQYQEAWMIFFIIHGFVRRTEAHKRNSAFESFPGSFESIPWRQVYKPTVEAQGASYPIMEHWDAGELSFGGAGTFWCFTELPRLGENISRKTKNEQTWKSKSGRIRNKKGFPDGIRVDKLVISSSDFDMLELTLDQEKPVVALCKIWRRGNAAALTPQPVEGLSIREGAVGMLTDRTQSQGQQEDNAQQHMCGYRVPPNSTNGVPYYVDPEGQLEDIPQPHMGGYVVRPNYIEGVPNSFGPEEQLGGIAQQHMGWSIVPRTNSSTNDVPYFAWTDGDIVHANIMSIYSFLAMASLSLEDHGAVGLSVYRLSKAGLVGIIKPALQSLALGIWYHRTWPGQLLDDIAQQSGQLDDTAQQHISEYMMLQNSMGIENSVGPGDQLMCPSAPKLIPASLAGCNQSTGQDHDSIYQGAVSFLYKEKGSFKHVAQCKRELACELASLAHFLATTMENILNILRINREPEHNRQASTSYDAQHMETASSAANPAGCAPGPETATQGEAEMQVTQEENHDNNVDFEEGWEVVNMDEENKIDIYRDRAM